MTQRVTWVADLAAANGEVFGADEECRFAGVLHDLGKYGTRFQGRLHGTEKHIDHWSAGACEAVLCAPKGVAAALAIQGHHIGLQRGERDSVAGLRVANLMKSHPLGCTLSDDDHEAIKRRAHADGFDWSSPSVSCFDWAMRSMDPVGQMLAVRMVFSALVDADFIATERHFKGFDTSGRRRDTVGLDADAARASLSAYIDKLARSSKAATGANAVRRARFWKPALNPVPDHRACSH